MSHFPLNNLGRLPVNISKLKIRKITCVDKVIRTKFFFNVSFCEKGKGGAGRKGDRGSQEGSTLTAENLMQGLNS